MPLRLVLTIADEITQIIEDNERPMARAATAAVRDVGEIAKRDGRASIAAGGFGPKWQNALRANVYPRKGDSIRAAAVIYQKVPYAIAFEEGAIIQGKPLLWLPLPTVPIGRGGRPIPASKFRQQVGMPLYTIRRPGNATATPVAKAAAAPKGRRPTKSPEPTERRTRANTKQAKLIAMLQRAKGATIEEIAEALDWQQHTVRGAIAGALKKKLGLEVTSDKDEKRGRVYRLAH
jgi:hypothetical protein